MALDSRFSKTVNKGGGDAIVDGLGRPKTAGIGIEDGRTVLDLGTGAWRSLSDEAAIELGYYLISAGELIKQRRSRSS